MVLRLCSTFFVLDSQEKIVVTRSMIVVGDAPTENHMAMIALTQPIEFMSQTTLSRVHVLKPKGLDFSLVFSYAHGLVGKVIQISIFLLQTLTPAFAVPPLGRRRRGRRGRGM